mgnify:CR=1 FL=1|jgi:AcrR family transcriptional regulator
MTSAVKTRTELGGIPFERDPTIWLANSNNYAIPHQQRSRLALERIVTAAVRLFATKGFDATPVSEIAAEAGVPIGTVYQRFADKGAILQTVIDGYRASRMNEIRALCDSPHAQACAPSEVVALHVDIIFSAFRTDTGLLRLLERRRLDDTQTHLDQSNANSEVAGLIAGLLIRKLPDRDPDELKRRVHYVHSIVRGSVVWSILPESGELGPGLQIADPAYADAALQMALAYLDLKDNGTIDV